MSVDWKRSCPTPCSTWASCSSKPGGWIAFVWIEENLSSYAVEKHRANNVMPASKRRAKRIRLADHEKDRTRASDWIGLPAAPRAHADDHGRGTI
jgi:hypothetical protein